MAEFDPKRARTPLPLPPQVALVFQGGGALGAFQAGVYEALDEADIHPDWVAGISIGAVNAAIIAGNPPARRVERLAEFWRILTSALPSFPIPWASDSERERLHELSAMQVATFGVPGFFAPRYFPPFFATPGTSEALSFYDPSLLYRTLDQLIDWDLLNSGAVRLSVGAVEIESGNFKFFDTAEERLDARHIMASGALPPGLPPVEIDGKLWWDGGLVSNTPLQHVVDHQSDDMLVFQVDLFSAKSTLPRTMMDVFAREKEIRFSSRTRQISDQLVAGRQRRQAVKRLLKKLPAAMLDDPDVKAVAELARDYAFSLVELIYRANAWEGGARDFEFSERTKTEHWQAGREAVANTMSKANVIATNILDGRTTAFDPTR